MAHEYAVLGGGVLGLTTALRLLERGHRVAVFEREPTPGGLAAGFRVDGGVDGGVDGSQSQPDAAGNAVWLEKFYHHLFRSDRAAIRLIEELGLANRLIWRRPLTVTLRGGRIYQLDSAMSVLRFTPLSMFSRLRMGAAIAYLKVLPSPAPLEGRTAARWLRRAMGRSAFETAWAPLLKGKFGALDDEIALPWFWARVHDRTAELGYVQGGFQHFYNRLVERIQTLGGEVCLATQIRCVQTDDAGFAVTIAPVDAPDRAERRTFERVISTLPTRLTCQLVPELPADYRARYDWGRAYGAHCLILALDRPLTQRYYWMNVNDPDYPFMALVEHTNYMPAEEYSGQHLVYLGNYRPMDDPLFRASHEEVLRQFTPHLAQINPAFDSSWIQRSWMFAAPFAQPIVTTEYREHIPPFDTPLKGLYLANMFQVYPHDRGQNYSIELAERVVRHVEARQ